MKKCSPNFIFIILSVVLQSNAILNRVQLFFISLNSHILLDSDTGVLDLSNQGLKKIPKSEDDPKLVRVLILDENELQKLENIDSYLRIEKVRTISSFNSD